MGTRNGLDGIARGVAEVARLVGVGRATIDRWRHDLDPATKKPEHPLARLMFEDPDGKLCLSHKDWFAYVDERRPSIRRKLRLPEVVWGAANIERLTGVSASDLTSLYSLVQRDQATRDSLGFLLWVEDFGRYRKLCIDRQDFLDWVLRQRTLASKPRRRAGASR